MPKKYLFCIIIAGLWGVFNLIPFLKGTDVYLFSDIILWFALGTSATTTIYIIELTLRMFPLFLFQIFFGTYIYQHFCSASIYQFSRFNRRINWFLKEVVLLYSYAFCFTLVMVLTGSFVVWLRGSLSFDRTSFIIFGYYLIIHSLWLFILTLSINIIAIKLNSSTAFSLISGGQILLTSALLLSSQTIDGIQNIWLLKINPIFYLILSWRSSFISAVHERIDLFGIGSDLNISVFLFIILTLIVIIGGAVLVKKHDLIATNSETGGI